MPRRLGSATLSYLAFPGESNPNFPWEKSHWDNTVVKSKKLFQKKFLGGVISNNATVSKDLDNRLSKANVAGSFAPSLQEDPGIHSRRRSHPPVRCRDLGSLPEVDQAT